MQLARYRDIHPSQPLIAARVLAVPRCFSGAFNHQPKGKQHMTGTARILDAAEWDGHAEQAIGELIQRYLAEHRAPAGSHVAGDLHNWAERLVTHGRARLDAAGVMASAIGEATA